MSRTRQKHVKNKIYRSIPKKRFYQMAVFWYFVLFLILGSTLLYFLLFFENFQIKNINISGNQKVNSWQINEAATNATTKKIIDFGFFKIYSKSIFLAKTDEIQNSILKISPAIKQVEILRHWPNGLEIKIEERKQFAAFCQEEKCFYIDDAGIIFEEVEVVPSQTIIVRQNNAVENLLIGEIAVQNNIMLAIYEIEKNLKENFQISLTDAMISTPIRLDVKTGEGWQIYFDIDTDSNISNQLTKLDLLLKQDIAAEARQNLEYIDLRFKNRAYYK